MVTIIHMAIMRHFENRTNKQKHNNMPSTAVNINRQINNSNINSTDHHSRSFFGSTVVINRALTLMGDSGRVRTRLNKKSKTSNTPASDPSMSNWLEDTAGLDDNLQRIDGDCEMFGHTGVGSTVTDTDMNDGQTAGCQPAEGQREHDDEQISRTEHVGTL